MPLRSVWARSGFGVGCRRRPRGIESIRSGRKISARRASRRSDRFGGLEVFLVHPYDIFLGKLFSSREKDRDDLRVLAGGLDRTALAARYVTANWYIVYGEPLPSQESSDDGARPGTLPEQVN